MVAPTRLITPGDRGDDLPCGSDPCRRVGHRQTDFLCRAANITCCGRQPSEGWHGRAIANVILPGSNLAITADAGHNQPRVDRCQYVVAEPKSLHDTGGKVLHQHIGLRHQRLNQFNASGLAQIDADTAFTLIPLVEHTRTIDTLVHVRGEDRQSSV